MISIIIPAYNSQKYIRRCLESIISQSYADLDIIVVNDGSDDSTADIVEQIQAKDKRVRLINKENGGVSSARNVGLDNSRSEYVMFIDADDWIDERYCENLVKYVEKYDLVACGFRRILTTGNHEYDVEYNQEFHNNNSEFFGLLYKNTIFNSPCTKIYKHKLIGELRFDEKKYLGEDLIFNFEYLKKCNDVMAISNNLYNYFCENEDSVTRKSYRNDVTSIIELYDLTIEFDKEYCNGEHIDLIQKDFLLCGIGVIQRIYYADIDTKEKRNYAKGLFESKAFEECFYKEYDVIRQYKYIQKLCAKKAYGSLNSFFLLKKIIYRIISLNKY